MPEGTTTNKVVQLKDPDTKEPISPVVNVGSIYDKNGKKVDNLLSYTIAGTDVPVPEIPSLKDQIKNQLDGTVDAATLGGSTKEEIIASVPAPDLSNVNAKLLEGHPASYFAPASAIPNLAGFSVQLLVDMTYTCDGVVRQAMTINQIPQNTYSLLYILDITNATGSANGSARFALTPENYTGNNVVCDAVCYHQSKSNGYHIIVKSSSDSSGVLQWRDMTTKVYYDNKIPLYVYSEGLSGTANIKVYVFCIG